MRKSVYNGSVGGLFGQMFIASLVASVTCGLMTPWAVCYVVKYIINNSSINGRQLKFTGSALSYFGNCLLWGLLTSVTCGIYTFWVAGDQLKWFIKNIHFEDSQGSPISEYDGSSLRLGCYLIITGSLMGSVVLAPWLATLLIKKIIANVTIDGEKLHFEYDESRFLDYYLANFLVFVTCGIYSFWLNHYLVEWFITGVNTNEPELLIEG